MVLNLLLQYLTFPVMLKSKKITFKKQTEKQLVFTKHYHESVIVERTQ